MKHSPGFEALCEEIRTQIHEVSPETTLEKVRSAEAVLIDVREDHEVAKGMIEGARHLGRGIIERDIENLIPEKDRELILYCGGGYRSALSAYNLQKMGYTNVHSMAGGWRGWNELGYPVRTET